MTPLPFGRNHLALSLLFAALTSCAPKSSSHAPHSSDTQVNSLMYQVLSEFSALQPFMVSETKFNDPDNAAELQNRLDSLAKLSKQVMHQKTMHTAGYRLTGAAMEQHFTETSKTFRSGNKKYSRWMLNATPYACASCHIQRPDSPRPLWEIKAAELAGTPMEKADFLFATQNYIEAGQIYATIIEAGNLDRENGANVDRALKKKLSIFIRIKRDFKGAEASLKQDLKNPRLNATVKRTIKSWLGQLSKISKLDDKLAQKPIRLISYATKTLKKMPRGLIAANYPRLVELLYVSGLLYESLHEHTQDEVTPSLLYWLGVADLSLNNEFFFSLGPTYLRQCIIQFPKSPIARRCYEEYLLEMHSLYSGSRGTELPRDIIVELSEFRKLVGIK